MRDNKGRYMKQSEEGLKITFILPTIKRIILWILTIVLLIPWLLIIITMDLLNLILLKFEEILLPRNEEIEKNGGDNKRVEYFIKYIIILN